MKEKIIEILSDILDEKFDYTGEDMFEDGIIDSLEMMELIAQMEEAFGIEIDAEDIVPENFKTIDTIVELLERTKAGN